MPTRVQRALTANLLGGFRVSIEAVRIDTVSRRRVRDVLAYLLAHRRAPVPRDVLMTVFWPDADRDAARNSLHVALSGLRQVLKNAHPEPVIERHFDTYRIAPSVTVWTDVRHFEQEYAAARRAEAAGDAAAALRHYEAACHVYEGDFLVDDPYSDWTVPIREALRLDAVHCRSRMVDMYIARGEFAPASLLARQVLANDPCNEAMHRQLMTCYSATSLRHLALAQYHRLATELWHTFRIRPSAETLSLYERLRQPCGMVA